MPPFKPFVLGALVLALVPACGVFHGGDHPEKAFTEKNLVAGGLGIGGVVNTTGNAGLADNGRELSVLMRTRLIETRQDIKIVSSSYIERRLGEAGYDALLKSYGARGELHGELFATVLPDLAERFRFIVFARIDADTVSKRLEYIGRVADQTYASTDFITRREIGIAFQAYDLETLDLVYTTHVTASGERSIRRLDRPPTPGTLTIRSPYPDPPALMEVALSGFDDFAKRLPGFNADVPRAE